MKEGTQKGKNIYKSLRNRFSSVFKKSANKITLFTGLGRRYEGTERKRHRREITSSRNNRSDAKTPQTLPVSPFSFLHWSVTIQRYNILAEILVSSITVYPTRERIRWIRETSRVNIRASTYYLYYYLCDHVSSPALTHSALDVRIRIIRVYVLYGMLRSSCFSLSLFSFSVWKCYNLLGEGNL